MTTDNKSLDLSAPLIMDQAEPKIEPDASIRVSMLVSGILWTIMVLAVVLLVTQILW